MLPIDMALSFSTKYNISILLKWLILNSLWPYLWCNILNLLKQRWIEGALHFLFTCAALDKGKGRPSPLSQHRWTLNFKVFRQNYMLESSSTPILPPDLHVSVRNARPRSPWSESSLLSWAKMREQYEKLGFSTKLAPQGALYQEQSLFLLPNSLSLNLGCRLK